jgi:hypothetical protein
MRRQLKNTFLIAEAVRKDKVLGFKLEAMSQEPAAD